MTIFDSPTRLIKLIVSIKISILVIALFLMLFSQTAFSKNKQFDVTAVLMAKLLEYVVWPDKNSHPQSKPTLCILEDPQQPPIKSLLLANGVLQKYFTIAKRTRGIKCHVIFISRQSKSGLNQILTEIDRNGPILTFSASDKYAQSGVMINFYTERQKVRFEVNWKVMKAAGLNISSRILKLARIIE